MMNAMEMPDTGGLSYPVVLYLAPGLACGAKAFTFPEAYRASAWRPGPGREVA